MHRIDLILIPLDSRITYVSHHIRGGFLYADMTKIVFFLLVRDLPRSRLVNEMPSTICPCMTTNYYVNSVAIQIE